MYYQVKRDTCIVIQVIFVCLLDVLGSGFLKTVKQQSVLSLVYTKEQSKARTTEWTFSDL